MNANRGGLVKQRTQRPTVRYISRLIARFKRSYRAKGSRSLCFLSLVRPSTKFGKKGSYEIERHWYPKYKNEIRQFYQRLLSRNSGVQTRPGFSASTLLPVR